MTPFFETAVAYALAARVTAVCVAASPLFLTIIVAWVLLPCKLDLDDHKPASRAILPQIIRIIRVKVVTDLQVRALRPAVMKREIEGDETGTVDVVDGMPSTILRISRT